MVCTLCNPRFKASRAKEIIAAVLKTRLTGAVYHADNTSSWAREIADDIKQKLKGDSAQLLACSPQALSKERRIRSRAALLGTVGHAWLMHEAFCNGQSLVELSDMRICVRAPAVQRRAGHGTSTQCKSSLGNSEERV